MDEGTFGILNGFIYFSQVDIVNHIQNNDPFLVELLSVFKGQTASPIQDDSPLDQTKRDTLMFLHQLFTLAKPLQAIGRIALYRGLIDRGLLHVVEWAFRRREAPILHTASEILTFTLEHDTNAVRNHILKEHDASSTTLLGEMIGIQSVTDNTGLASHLSDSIRHLLDIPHEGEVSYMLPCQDLAYDQSIFVRKEGPLADNFITFFYETSASSLFRPITDMPHMDKESRSFLYQDWTIPNIQTPHLDYLDHAYLSLYCLLSSYHSVFHTTHIALHISSYLIQSPNQSSTSFKLRTSPCDMVSLPAFLFVASYADN